MTLNVIVIDYTFFLLRCNPHDCVLLGHVNYRTLIMHRIPTAYHVFISGKILYWKAIYDPFFSHLLFDVPLLCCLLQFILETWISGVIRWILEKNLSYSICHEHLWFPFLQNLLILILCWASWTQTLANKVFEQHLKEIVQHAINPLWER